MITDCITSLYIVSKCSGIHYQIFVQINLVLKHYIYSRETYEVNSTHITPYTMIIRSTTLCTSQRRKIENTQIVSHFKYVNTLSDHHSRASSNWSKLSHHQSLSQTVELELFRRLQGELNSILVSGSQVYAVRSDDALKIKKNLCEIMVN